MDTPVPIHRPRPGPLLQAAAGVALAAGTGRLNWRLLASPALSFRGAVAAGLCGAALLALAPGLGVFRVDVGAFTLIFLAMPAAIGFEHLWRRLPRARIVLLALSLITLSLGLNGGWVRMQDLNVLSLNSISHNGSVLSGQVGPSLSFVPAPRRERLAARYAGFGVGIGFSAWLENEREVAAAARRFNPDGSGHPYRYAWDFLSSRPYWWNVMSMRVRRAITASTNRVGP